MLCGGSSRPDTAIQMRRARYEARRRHGDATTRRVRLLLQQKDGSAFEKASGPRGQPC